jgi:hypothetical protein
MKEIKTPAKFYENLKEGNIILFTNKKEDSNHVLVRVDGCDAEGIFFTKAYSIIGTFGRQIKFQDMGMDMSWNPSSGSDVPDLENFSINLLSKEEMDWANLQIFTESL